MRVRKGNGFLGRNLSFLLSSGCRRQGKVMGVAMYINALEKAKQKAIRIRATFGHTRSDSNSCTAAYEGGELDGPLLPSVKEG
ncbi:unnamed protein product [Dovyalis caffra]|uniref:Uncharacterized protein n=1 Tax=Dovyalis caffra TaxID=77055 RepID=A0AAV1RCH9_9ROSI|nr:unnamed protein product [Dovyalis caffra]